MTEPFEDDIVDGDGRKATQEDAQKVYDWLVSRRRTATVNCVLDELMARNFTASRSTVGRYIKRAPDIPPNPGAPPKNPIADATHRVASRRSTNAGMQIENQEIAQAVGTINTHTEQSITTIAELTAADRTSTALAILENRERMALNIIVMRKMADKPDLLLLDMRGAAALIDALTCAAKLSGGASIDISVGGDEPRALNGANGHDMKDVTPDEKTSALIEQIATWRGQQRLKKSNGQGNSGD